MSQTAAHLVAMFLPHLPAHRWQIPAGNLTFVGVGLRCLWSRAGLKRQPHATSARSDENRSRSSQPAGVWLGVWFGPSFDLRPRSAAGPEPQIGL